MLETLRTIAGGVADRIPEGAASWVGDIIDRVKASPALLAVVAVVGAVTALVFVIGIVRHAFKAAIVGGLISVGAQYWFHTLR